MKKLFTNFILLTFVLILAGCNKDGDLKLMHKSYLGEVISLSNTSVTIDSSTTLNEETFIISDTTLHIPTDLQIGDKVVVEVEFLTNEPKPYTAIIINYKD